MKRRRPTCRSRSRNASGTARCKRLAGLCLAAVAAFPACAGDTGTGWSTTTTTLPGGARVVRHAPPPGEAPATWRLEPDLRIGTLDRPGPAMFGHIADLAVHPDGRIVVLDAQAQEIRVFGPDGAHLRTFGRKGGGPGEYQGANGVVFGPDGLLRVPDAENARMSFVDPDSGFVRSHPYQPLMFGRTWAGIVDSVGQAWSPHYLMGEEEGDPGAMAFVGYDTAGVAVDTLNRPREVPHPLDDHPGRWSVFSEGRLVASVAVPDYAWEQHVLTRDLDVWSTTDGDPSYRLIRWTPGPGDTTLVIETGRPLPPVDAEAADSVIARYERQLGTSLDRSKIPDHAPAIRAFFMDDDGRLWVQVRTPDDSLQTFDAYDANGAYLGTLVTDLALQATPAPVIRGDRLWGVVRDELDVPFVVRGRLVPPEP
jgi:hypothetical protein